MNTTVSSGRRRWTPASWPAWRPWHTGGCSLSGLFTSVALSPLCPLGTVSAVATADQNKMVTTVRTTEVVADTTNVLALECAVRRREALRSIRAHAGGSGWRPFTGWCAPRPSPDRDMAAHFTLLGLCTAGRDEGSFAFETTALAEQIGVHLDILDDVRVLGHRVAAVRVSITDLTAGRHRGALLENVLDPLTQAYPGTAFAFDDDRVHGRGYYRDACFEIRATTPAGDDLNLGDGGFVTWSADLLGNAKERLLTSGLGLERLSACFGPPSFGDQTGIRPT